MKRNSAEKRRILSYSYTVVKGVVPYIASQLQLQHPLAQ